MSSSADPNNNFEPDNGWLDVDGASAYFTADDHQFLAGSSSAYLINPIASVLMKLKAFCVVFG